MTATSRGHNADPTSTKRRWRTPPALYSVLDREFHFRLDAAAEDGASLAEYWITPEMDTLVTSWRDHARTNMRGRLAVFANFPWGPRYTACPADCRKEHAHHADSFPGTGAFVNRALDQARTLDDVVLLLPTAPDTSWWRAAFCASHEVRLLPRVSFLDAPTPVGPERATWLRVQLASEEARGVAAELETGESDQGAHERMVELIETIALGVADAE